MNTKAVVMSAILAAGAAFSATVNYGWEDGETVVGKYGDILISNVASPVLSGSHSLQLVDSSQGSATPQAYVAWINGLHHGDTVSASFWRFDTTPSTNPSCRIWGHYTKNSIDSLAGTASGNSDYGTGTGWEETNYSWIFDTTGGRTGLVVEVRTYTTYPHTVWVDEMTVTAPDYATIDVGNLGITVPPPPADTVDTTLIAYWSFEKSGKDFVFFDETSNKFDLVAMSGNKNVKLLTGPYGRYLKQDSSGGELLVRNSKGAFNFPHFTVEALVSPVPTGDFQTIFSSSECFNNTSAGHGLVITPEGNLRLSLSKIPSWYHLFSRTRLQVGQIYHITATFDGIAMKIFINGVLDSSVQYSTPFVNGAGHAVIGRSIIDGRSYSITKSPIDEIKFYNRAVTEAEVAAKYQALMDR